MDGLRDVRRLYRIADVLGIDARKRVIVCPLPQHIHYNNTPSFSIFPGDIDGDRFKCHGSCGRGGDVIDLVGYLHIPGYDGNNPEHVRMAVSQLSQRVAINLATPQIETVVLNNNAWRSYPIGPEALDYAIGRGLSLETVDKFHLGQKANSMSIPIFCDDQLYAIKFRRISGSGPRYWAARGSKMALFNVDRVKWKEEPVLILKGEIAVMLLDQLGFNACCMTAGEGAKIDEWTHYLAFSSRKVLVGDNDKDEKIRHRMQALSAERAAQWGAILKFPPDAYKDIDEWILADDSAVNTIKEWVNARELRY